MTGGCPRVAAAFASVPTRSMRHPCVSASLTAWMSRLPSAPSRTRSEYSSAVSGRRLEEPTGGVRHSAKACGFCTRAGASVSMDGEGRRWGRRRSSSRKRGEKSCHGGQSGLQRCGDKASGRSPHAGARTGARPPSACGGDPYSAVMRYRLLPGCRVRRYGRFFNRGTLGRHPRGRAEHPTRPHSPHLITEQEKDDRRRGDRP